jgi:hypothetical protein
VGDVDVAVEDIARAPDAAGAGLNSTDGSTAVFSYATEGTSQSPKSVPATTRRASEPSTATLHSSPLWPPPCGCSFIEKRVRSLSGENPMTRRDVRFLPPRVTTGCSWEVAA